ncbi:MAG: Asp-tRNA(Asn)/Glu-tRNA(Gln) amidotransferase subunit GatC [Deltaproteobacteria bacterium]|nr:Asp-tRNA(Asn)/Glu-tRNA(Gln) amidotransferase subunit GatC [Deltaproteobacteria bacterium]
MAALEVTPELVRATAALARLELTDAELPGMVAQLQRILDHVSVLEALDAEGPVEEPPAPSGALREDTPRPCLDRDEVLSQAPRSAEGFFLVPSVLEE